MSIDKLLTKVKSRINEALIMKVAKYKNYKYKDYKITSCISAFMIAVLSARIFIVQEDVAFSYGALVSFILLQTFMLYEGLKVRKLYRDALSGNFISLIEFRDVPGVDNEMQRLTPEEVQMLFECDMNAASVKRLSNSILERGYITYEDVYYLKGFIDRDAFVHERYANFIEQNELVLPETAHNLKRILEFGQQQNNKKFNSKDML